MTSGDSKLIHQQLRNPWDWTTSSWTGSVDHTKTTINLQNPALQATFSQSQRQNSSIQPPFLLSDRQLCRLCAALPPSYLAASAFVNDFKERVNRAEHPGRRCPGGAPQYGSGRYVAQCTFSFSFSPLFFSSFLSFVLFWCFLMCPHK